MGLSSFYDEDTRPESFEFAFGDSERVFWIYSLELILVIGELKGKDSLAGGGPGLVQTHFGYRGVV